jgi:hypothetical protein
VHPGMTHVRTAERTGTEARRLGRPADLLARLVAAGGLAYSGYAHWHLHTQYAGNRTSVLSQGDVFIAQAVACAVAALAVLLVRPRSGGFSRATLVAWLFAFAVAGGSLLAVLVYRYVDVGRIGPLPDMYEPVWYALKSRSAVAEGLATAATAAGLGLLLIRRPRA